MIDRMDNSSFPHGLLVLTNQLRFWAVCFTVERVKIIVLVCSQMGQVCWQKGDGSWRILDGWQERRSDLKGRQLRLQRGNVLTLVFWFSTNPNADFSGVSSTTLPNPFKLFLSDFHWLPSADDRASEVRIGGAALKWMLKRSVWHIPFPISEIFRQNP